jgi:phage shock protein PspC (stress-responsive transcriptional regulator)
MKKLYRYPKKGYIGGVCHGMGEHTNIDPIIWRIVTVFGGLGFVYLIFLDCFKKRGSIKSTFTVFYAQN